MSILSKIKAFFRFNGQSVELEVSRAEIKKDRVFLHPINDDDHVIAIKSSEVNIMINPNSDLRDEDVQVFEHSKKDDENISNETKKKKTTKSSKEKTSDPTVWKEKPLSDYMTKKKKVTFQLYPEDYEAVMNALKGVQKNEYLLACFTSAKKNSLEATYKRYTVEHKARRAAERKAAEIAREQDYIQWKNQMEATAPLTNDTP